MNAKTCLLACMLLIASTFTAHATDKKTTNLKFEDELVHGQSLNPDLLLLLTQPEQHHSRLIHLRQDFKAEMRQTADSVRRH